jgi:hypothetical protein
MENKLIEFRLQTLRLPVSIAALLLAGVVIVFLTSVIPVPVDSHYFVSILPTIPEYDIYILKIYNLLRTPIYSVLSSLFSNHAYYVVLTYISYLILIFILFGLIFEVSRNVANSVVVTFLIILFPVVINITNWVKLSSLADFIQYIYPVHFGFSAGGFTVRVITGAIWLLALILFIRAKYAALLALLPIAFLVHPNNSISICVQFVVAYLTLLVLDKELRYLWLASGILAIAFIGIAPGFYSSHELGQFVQNPISNQEWYFALLKDEGDDFSPLFYLTRMYTGLMFYVLLVFVLLLTGWRSGANVKDKRLLALTVAPIIIFAGSVLTELVMVKFDLFFLAPLLIPVQFGMKAIQMSTVPLVCYLLSRWKDFNPSILRRIVKVLIFSTILISLLALLINGAKRMDIRVNSYLSVFRDVRGGTYWDVTQSLCSKINYNPSFVPMYIISPEIKEAFNLYKGSKTIPELKMLDSKIADILTSDEAYGNQYGNCQALIDFVSLVEANIPGGSSIIVPPYMAMLRDILPKYSLFFVDKHDGNLVLGSVHVATEMYKRIELLLGMRYFDMASLSSGLIESQTRWLFLNRKRVDLENIKKNYPQYRYLITEVKHVLDFPVIAQSELYVIYKIE